TDEAGVIFGCQLQRRERRVLTDLVRGDLIGRDSRKSIRTLCRFRPNAAEPCRGTERMDRGGVRGLVMQTAYYTDIFAERLEGFEDRSELEVGALGFRRPPIHDCAVGYVNESKPGSRVRGRVSRHRRNH